jgi:membrane protein required for colicin V production
MYWLDTAILVLLGVGAALGAWTGLVKQVVRVVGLIVSIYAAVVFHGWAANWLQQTLLQGSDPAVPDALSYVVVFVVIFAAFLATAMLIERGLKAVKLKWLDRLLGACVGAAKAAVIMGAIFLAVIEFPHQGTKDVIGQSQIAPVLAGGVNLCLQLVPTEYTHKMQDGMNKLKTAADEKAREMKDRSALPVP